MIFDLNSLAFFLTSLIGGIIAVPIGGSFLLVIPIFLFLGLNGLQTLLLSRIFATSAMVSASSYFFTNHKFEWKKIFYFLSGNIFGYILAAKLATSINIATLTKIIPWVLLLGAILLLKDWKIEKLHHQKIFAKLLPLLGFLTGFYGGMGGAGMGPTIVLLLALAFSWGIHKSIVNTRMIELFGNALVVAAYLYFGAKFTGFELPVILGGLLGGFIGAKITLKSKPVWLKKAFLVLVVISAIKTTFF
ncbi:sulfite exporter TauE/SafE family protein [Candidatus Gracilibacteria bacterium]|nr:sulfite exporter TauE/SafE family protein [Candidatus Gracilibacteria bacterium]MCF7856631.1 sulfite exporter TauE/SafE family protein [Candidatus Gracilibacteria bacterium]MCF7896931.1 sulfite exporter TauE/SafE family protein [Candidatus Gracilibacteria bacterium]